MLYKNRLYKARYIFVSDEALASKDKTVCALELLTGSADYISRQEIEKLYEPADGFKIMSTSKTVKHTCKTCKFVVRAPLEAEIFCDKCEKSLTVKLK